MTRCDMMFHVVFMWFSCGSNYMSHVVIPCGYSMWYYVVVPHGPHGMTWDRVEGSRERIGRTREAKPPSPPTASKAWHRKELCQALASGVRS